MRFLGVFLSPEYILSCQHVLLTLPVRCMDYCVGHSETVYQVHSYPISQSSFEILCLINGRPNSGLFLKRKKKAFVIICQSSFKVDTDRSPIYDWNQQHSQSLHHWQEYWYLVWLILSPCWDICIPWVTTSSPSTSLQNPTKWWLFLLSNSFQKGECSFSLKSTGLAVNHFDHNINDGQSLLIQSFISRKSIPPVFWKPQMKSLMLSVYQLKTYWLQICQLLVQWLLERLPKL